MELPLYNAALDDYDEGMFGISLVKDPAISKNFMYFSKEEATNKVAFQFTNSEKGEIVGPIMIPDFPMYRSGGPEGDGYMINFTEEVIEQIVERYFENGWDVNSFTLNHNANVNKGGINIMELWIKGEGADKSDVFGFSDLPKGTAFIRAKVKDDFIKESIKNNSLNGFSIEIMASIVKSNTQSMFKNEVTVGDAVLVFNNVTEVVLQKGEGNALLPFSGEFEHEKKTYVVENGVATEKEEPQETEAEKAARLAKEAENREFNAKEAVEALDKKVDGMIDTIMESFKTVEQAIAGQSAKMEFSKREQDTEKKFLTIGEKLKFLKDLTAPQNKKE